jgi:hypothetical protein
MGMSVSTSISFCWEVSEQGWASIHAKLYGELDYWYGEGNGSIRSLIIKAFEECEAKAKAEAEEDGIYNPEEPWDWDWEIEKEHLNTEEETIILSLDISGGAGTYGEEVETIEPKKMVSSERRFLKHDDETKEHLLYILNAPVRYTNEEADEEDKITPLTAEDLPKFMKWRLYGSVC